MARQFGPRLCRTFPVPQFASVDRRQANTGWLLGRCVKGDAAKSRRWRRRGMSEPSQMPEVLGRPAHHNLGVDAASGVEGCGVDSSNAASRREYSAVLLQRVARILLQVFPQLGRPPLDPRDLPPQDHLDDIGQAVIRNVSPAV
jgi:hypothetical protein